MQVKAGGSHDFTKQDHLKCSEPRRHHKTKRRPSTRAAPMPLAKRQPIGTPSMLERHTISSSCNGILFNHESPRRGETFVTRKITRALGRIKFGLQEKLYLGNLDARRDWGHAADYVRAMWMMLQHDSPGDYVVATGESHSVREFLDLAASFAGVNWKSYVETDPRYFRPTEVDFLQGDASKARRILGWQPEISFQELVRSMTLTPKIFFVCKDFSWRLCGDPG